MRTNQRLKNSTNVIELLASGTAGTGVRTLPRFLESSMGKTQRSRSETTLLPWTGIRAVGWEDISFVALGLAGVAAIVLALEFPW